MPDFKISLKARLILYHKGKILLLKQTKPNGGNYTLVGGNVESREYALEALIRESYEEAGIIIREKDLSLVHVMQKNKGKEQRVVLYFKAKKWEGEIESREPHKFADVKWFPLDELPRNITGTVKQALKAYRNGIMYSQMDK
ncbi:MAG: NUDIX domain-containing protein [Saprospiraceae bacterium]|nr:NUDIX domain-containing protein [Saprospiraceae bacterium]MCB9323680.1 NUDIX domain-containing protein [Lewinellaceae bacterium]